MAQVFRRLAFGGPRAGIQGKGNGRVALLLPQQIQNTGGIAPPRERENKRFIAYQLVPKQRHIGGRDTIQMPRK